MVTRLILLIILGFVAALYFPDSRQVIVEQANPVIQPVLVWSAEREIQRLSQGVRMEAREKYTLPTNRTWKFFPVTAPPTRGVHSTRIRPGLTLLRSDRMVRMGKGTPRTTSALLNIAPTSWSDEGTSACGYPIFCVAAAPA